MSYLRKSHAEDFSGYELEWMRIHLQCWVKWSVTRGAAHSPLGSGGTIPAPHHRSMNSRLAWYIDIERLLNTLPPTHRRMVILSALGHTQRCISREVGVSLRSVVRYCFETLELLEDRAKDQQHGAGIFKKLPLSRPSRPPSAAESRKWLDPPMNCICLHSRVGRPPKIRAPEMRFALQ